jgi:hypothetical protein
MGLAPHYVCQARGIAAGQPPCQQLPAAAIDAAVGELLLATLTPMTLAVPLAVEQELPARLDEAARSRAVATCASTPTLGSWPMRWRPSGTSSCVLLAGGARGV